MLIKWIKISLQKPEKIWDQTKYIAKSDIPLTRCPKAIHGHRYPCPTSDFSFFVIFCVSRAAAPEGTGGDGVLTSIF